MDGFKKIFNSHTIDGRANVAKATYASFALLYLSYRFKKKKTPPPPAPPAPPVPSPPSTTTTITRVDPPLDSPELRSCMQSIECDKEDQFIPLPELPSQMQDFTENESGTQNV